MFIKDSNHMLEDICKLISSVCDGTLCITLNGCSFILSTTPSTLIIYSAGSREVSNGQPIHLISIRRNSNTNHIHHDKIIKTIYKFLEENHGVTQALNDLKQHKDNCLSVLSGGYL